jgi:hypothetical protein
VRVALNVTWFYAACEFDQTNHRQFSTYCENWISHGQEQDKSPSQLSQKGAR